MPTWMKISCDGTSITRINVPQEQVYAHLGGPVTFVGAIPALNAIYAEQNIAADIRPFFADVAGVMASADLIISRAGASTVAELAAAGRPSVLIPFAHALDGHQQANANQLAGVGGTASLSEKDASAAHLAELLEELLSTPERRQEHARAARTIARPDAAKQICSVLEQHLSSPSQEAA